MEIYPQPEGFSFERAGPVYALLAEENQTASIEATATAPIAVDDELTFDFWILAEQGVSEIRLYHGETLVETFTNRGPCSISHTADNDSSLIRFEAGPDEAPFAYQIACISVTLA